LPDSVVLVNPPDTTATDTLSWHFASLAAGDSLVIELQALVPDSVVLPSIPFERTNSAWMSAPNDTNPANDHASAAVFVVEPRYDLTLSKSVTPDTVLKGGVFTYAFKILNLGPDEAADLTLQDALPDSVVLVNPPDTTATDTLSWYFASLAAGDSLVIEFQALVPDSVALPSIPFERTNSAWVSAPNDTNPTNDHASASVFVVEQNFDLELEKSVFPDKAFQGQVFEYTLKITNPTPVPSGPMVLRDAIPAFVKLSGFTLAPDLVTADTLFWHLAALAPQDSTVISYAAEVPACLALPSDTLELVNHSLVRAPNEKNTANNSDSAKVVLVAVACPKNYDLQLTKSVNRDSVIAGEAFAYTLKIENLGPNPARRILLRDAFPALLTFSDFNLQPTRMEPDTLFWTFDSLSVGDSIEIVFSAKTAQALPASSFPIVNTSRVSAPNDTNAVNNFADAEVVAIQPHNDCIVLDQNVFEPDQGRPLGISFELQASTHVRMDLFDISGYHVTELVERNFSAGPNLFRWKGLTKTNQPVGSGVYLIIFRSNDLTCLEKVVIVR
ncbi:MAG: hypothetical protein ACE5HO_19140, partial [bacterium]